MVHSADARVLAVMLRCHILQQEAGRAVLLHLLQLRKDVHQREERVGMGTMQPLALASR
jgi:hypothetical protein